MIAPTVAQHLVLSDFASSSRQLEAGAILDDENEDMPRLRASGLVAIPYTASMQVYVDRWRNQAKVNSFTRSSLGVQLLVAGFFGDGNGNVIGPPDSAEDELALFGSTSGKLLARSGAFLTAGNLTVPGTVQGRDVSADGALLDATVIAVVDHIGDTGNPHATTAAQVGAPPSSRQVATSSPLTGGGDLSVDRTIGLPNATSLASGAQSGSDKAKLDGLPASAVPTSRQVTTAAPLTGGGPLSADLALAIDPATGVARGTMAAADFTKLAGLPSDAVPLTGHAATSLVGRAAGSAGAAADIAAGADETFPQRVAGALTWGALRLAMIADNLITGLKVQLVTTLVQGVMSAADKLKLDGLPSSAVPTSRAVNTAAPLTGGGPLSADLSLAITAASAVAAGTMSAADFSKLLALSAYEGLVLVFRPGAASSGRFASTWAEVAAAIAADPNLTVIVDDSLAACTASSSVDCLGRTNFVGLRQFFIGASLLTITNGVTISNPGTVTRLKLTGSPTSSATPSIRFTLANTSWRLYYGAQFELGATATVAGVALDVSTAIRLDNASLSTLAGAGIAIVTAASGQNAVCTQIATGTALPVNTFGGGAGAGALTVSSDAFVLPTVQTLWTGGGAATYTRSQKGANLEPSQGTTAARPAAPAVGQEYFDTTLGQPVWWNGAAWVTAFLTQTVGGNGPTNITTGVGADAVFETLTPGAGTWLVLWSGSAQYPNVQSVTASIFANGAQVANTEQSISGDQGTLSVTGLGGFGTHAIVTVAAAQAIDGRMRRSGGTGILNQRKLTLIKLA